MGRCSLFYRVVQVVYCAEAVTRIPGESGEDGVLEEEVDDIPVRLVPPSSGGENSGFDVPDGRCVLVVCPGAFFVDMPALDELLANSRVERLVDDGIDGLPAEEGVGPGGVPHCHTFLCSLVSYLAEPGLSFLMLLSCCQKWLGRHTTSHGGSRSLMRCRCSGFV